MFRLTQLSRKLFSVQELKSWNQDVVKSTKPVLVDFYASWCGPCKRLTPILEEKVNSHPNVTLVKVDIEKHENIAEKYKIEVVPTVLLFTNGKQVDSFQGLPPPHVLNAFFEKIPKQ